MKKQQDTSMYAQTAGKSGKAKRWIMAAALAVAVGATGVAAANGAGGLHGMHGRGHHGPVDAATMARIIDKMIEKVAPDATAQQKVRLAEIAKSAHTDIAPIRAQLREGHKKAHELLMQPVVDRVALESLRAENMQRMDALSKRMLGAVADAADILTPEQRARFHQHMKRRMHG